MNWKKVASELRIQSGALAEKMTEFHQEKNSRGVLFVLNGLSAAIESGLEQDKP